jgi:polygalacturonase
MSDRRQFLKALFAGGALSVGAVRLLEAGPALPQPRLDIPGGRRDPWDALPPILERVRAPQFPGREFLITQFGAVGDNQTDCTDPFRRAIDACHAAGGGSVVVPAGTFLSGAITLRSGVNLHVSERATIRFSRDPNRYPVVFTRWEGTELMNFSPFIYAFEQENIAVTGQGTLDGNSDADHWWPWKGQRRFGGKDGAPDQAPDRRRLQEMAEKGLPVGERVFGPGHYLRPQFIQPYRSKNVLIEGVTLLNSPMWHVHPVLCTNVVVRGLTIRSSGPNTDGCNPESCTDVLIDHCLFNTGDDCIAIKSGRNADGRRLNTPSRNIVIRNCRMEDGHGGVTLGSEDSGGIRDVFAVGCHMSSPRLEVALRIKNNAARGGLLENIYARDIEVGQVASAGLSIDFNYEEGAAGKFTPVARHIEIQRLHVQRAKYALYLRGLKNAPIENIRLVNCDFEQVAESNVIENVTSLALENVRINGTIASR